MRKELGDFQTPAALAELVVANAASSRQFLRVLEPTCGEGNFIHACLSAIPTAREVIGLDIQVGYCDSASMRFSSDSRVRVLREDALRVDFGRDLPWTCSGPMLVIGNLPWVTNAEIGQLNGQNLPQKRNLKQLSGLDALTGSSNFDIAEYILIRLVEGLEDTEARVAVLCKTSVARAFVRYAADRRMAVNAISMRAIDAKRWFGVSADACLLMFDLRGASSYEIDVFDHLESELPFRRIHLRGGAWVSRTDQAHLLTDESHLVWRQGLKHDAAAVMELHKTEDGILRNKSEAMVDVELDYVFPLAKGTDVFHGRPPTRAVVVTQTKVGQDTRPLEQEAPRLWKYLSSNAAHFLRRKSRIYVGRHPFSMFGVGPYSFAPFKVAVSGLHKQARFRLLTPLEGRPVMLDDTCYFVGVNNAVTAAVLVAMLNGPVCQDLIGSIAFWDSKRPITKSLLSRVDVLAVLSHESKEQVAQQANALLHNLESPTQVHASDLESYLALLGDTAEAEATPVLDLFTR